MIVQMLCSAIYCIITGAYLLNIYGISTDRGEVPAHVSDKDVGWGQGAVLLLLQLALQLQPQVGDVQLGDHSVY